MKTEVCVEVWMLSLREISYGFLSPPEIMAFGKLERCEFTYTALGRHSSRATYILSRLQLTF